VGMDVREVDQRWGATAAKWVWSARPRYLFEDDGTERADLEPVDEVIAEDYSDELGWWTCDRKTEMHDLAVIYRTAGKADDLVRGPKDLCYVCLAVSDAFRLADDPLAGAFSKHFGCRCVVVARFEPPIRIAELRADPVIRDWGALKAGFVKAAMPMPANIWTRLVEMTGSPRAPRRPPVTGRATPRLPERQRRRVEGRLEDWLEAHPQALREVGLDVVVHQRQMLCVPDHNGTIDLLCRRAGQDGDFVVVELKAEEIRREAVAQALGYVGWLRSQPGVRTVTALIIGLDLHPQVLSDTLGGDGGGGQRHGA